MNWVLIALSAGMLLTSQHETEEACLGRKAVIEKELKVKIAKCENLSTTLSFTGNGGITITPGTCINGICGGSR